MLYYSFEIWPKKEEEYFGLNYKEWATGQITLYPITQKKKKKKKKKNF